MRDITLAMIADANNVITMWETATERPIWSNSTEELVETDPSKTFINLLFIYTMILEVNEADRAKSCIDI